MKTTANVITTVNPPVVVAPPATLGCTCSTVHTCGFRVCWCGADARYTHVHFKFDPLPAWPVPVQPSVTGLT